MQQDTKNRMAEIIAAATAKVGKNNLSTKITPQDIKHIADDIASEEQRTKANNTPAKMLSFTIIWHEGKQRFENTTFNTWSAANDALRWICNQHEGVGYTKVKANVKWDNGAEITDRIDCSQSGGDFWANRETIGQYLSRQSSVMYGSNINKGERYLLSFEDEKEAPAAEIVAPVQDTPKNTDAATIKIVDYSQKSFAVIFDKKPTNDILNVCRIYGTFNRFLSCGAGWIFSKRHLDSVKTQLNLC